MASPEKALLDLFYLMAGSDESGYLQQLRFEPSKKFDWARAAALAPAMRSRKLIRAIDRLHDMLAAQEKGSGS